MLGGNLRSVASRPAGRAADASGLSPRLSIIRGLVTGSPFVLVVDDDVQMLKLVARVAHQEGFQVVTCENGRQAMEELRRQPADLAIVDLMMPEVNGLDVLREMRAEVPECEVVLMSGHADVSAAVEAIKLGGRDYLTKPLDLTRLRELLHSTREESERRRALLASESRLARQLTFCGMIGRSPAMQDLFALLRRLGPHVRSALITGETGSGKELVARALHELGPRSRRPFVAVNCSAVVETLFESELFGHVRGAFTGAVTAKAGLFEAAHQGTLFLDEVGELPAGVQAKLLRVLEAGEVQRIGGLEPRRVDVSVLAATNRDLRVETAERRFRSDLFYRLNVVEVRVPPLRDHREDIPYLTAAFVEEFARRLDKKLALSPGAERLLQSAPWAGNVRELRNAIERVCLLADKAVITEREVEAGLAPPAPARPAGEEPAAVASLLDAEREHILRVLRQTKGNKYAAAQILGVSRRALYRHLERLGLSDMVRRPANDRPQSRSRASS